MNAVYNDPDPPTYNIVLSDKTPTNPRIPA